MRISVVSASTLLCALAGAPTGAQSISPVAVRPLFADAAASSAQPSSATPRPTHLSGQSARPLNRVLTVAGGALGGVAGGFIGAGLGYQAAQSCTGEDCGLIAGILGAGLGEAIGVAVGSHVGSRSPHHENILLSSLVSTGILVGGGYASSFMGRTAPIMIPLTPMLQLAAALALESRP